MGTCTCHRVPGRQGSHPAASLALSRAVRVCTTTGVKHSGVYAGTETHLDEVSGEPEVILFVEKPGHLSGLPVNAISSVEVVDGLDNPQDVIHEMHAVLTQQQTVEVPLWRMVATGSHDYLEITVTPRSVACEDQ